MQHPSFLRTVRRVALAVALVVLFSPTPRLSATHSLRLVFFGDSLSDSGNHFIAFRDISTRPFQLVPDAPYAVGGLHFTNGATWAEQVSLRLRTPASGLPSLLRAGVHTRSASASKQADCVSGVDPAVMPRRRTPPRG